MGEGIGEQEMEELVPESSSLSSSSSNFFIESHDKNASDYNSIKYIHV